MKLAFSTLGCPAWSIVQAADAAQRYGYDGIELRLYGGEVITPALPAAARQEIRAVLADARLALVALDTSVQVAHSDPARAAAERDTGVAMVELAAELGAPIIRVFGGGTSHAQAAETLAFLAAHGAPLGVQVALETHDAFSAGAQVAAVLTLAGPGPGALWDLLHPCRVGETPAQTLALLRDRLLLVHIKDGQPLAVGGETWDLTLLGDGAVPTVAILTALHAAGYDGWLSVEWEKRWHPHLADPEIALPQHADRLRAWLAALATRIGT